MLFINTRPKARAEQLNRCLQAAGYQVVNFPLLELIESPYSDELADLYQQLPQSQAIVVVSPTAAEIGLRYWQQSGGQIQQLKHIQWVAVGQATADYLAQYRIVAQVPDIETSEGMLRLDIFQALSSLRQVAFWRGQGGRQFMMQHLFDAGIRVLNFVLYSRHCPVETRQSLPVLESRLLATTETVYVLISSEASWLNWLALFKDESSLSHRYCYMVLGERLFHILMTYQIQQHAYYAVCRVDDLKPDTILAQLQRNKGCL